MLISELQNLAAMDELNEGVLDMPDDSSLVEQLSILIQRLDTAKRALGITNQLKDPVARKKHRGRVMTFLNQLRGMFDRVTNQLQQEITQDAVQQQSPQYPVQVRPTYSVQRT